jgi:hypothetical protein
MTENDVVPDKDVPGCLYEDEGQTSEVWIVLVRDRDARSVRQRISEVWERIRPVLQRTCLPLYGLLAASAIAAMVIGVWLGNHDGTWHARAAGEAGIASAYGYPLRCLSITRSADYPQYARADFDRLRACGRYDWTAVAILRQDHGTWQTVVRASNYICPLAGLPRPVQRALLVCP